MKSQTSYLDALIQPTTKYNLNNNYYISGTKGCSITRTLSISPYFPAGLSQAFELLINIQNQHSEQLYLLCPKNYAQKGNYVKAGISETCHFDEKPLDTLYRGVLEEAQIKLLGIPIHHFQVEHHNKKYTHYFFHLSSSKDYVHEIPIDPETLKDNRNNKVVVYLFGTLANLQPILNSFEPFPYNDENRKKKIDPISNLVLIPFSQLFIFKPDISKTDYLRFIKN
jgi:hypothetical protein